MRLKTYLGITGSRNIKKFINLSCKADPKLFNICTFITGFCKYLFSTEPQYRAVTRHKLRTVKRIDIIFMPISVILQIYDTGKKRVLEAGGGGRGGR